MKHIVRKWLGIDSLFPQAEDDRSLRTVAASDLLSGAELVAVAYRIENGYLLRIGNGMGLGAVVIYCTDEKEIADKMVVYRAKAKMGLTAAQVLKSQYAGNSVSSSI